MPTITVQQSLMNQFLQLQNISLDKDKIMNELPLLGTDVDRCDDEELVVEIFPDRPDLLSGETLSYAMGPFLYNTPSRPTLDITPSSIQMNVDPSLEHVRPIVCGAVVRGVNVPDEQSDEFIKALMDHQEKLHFAIGRGRRRASIGVHDLDTLQPPFRVTTVDRSFGFVPLGHTSEMSIDEILSTHAKGMDYAHLLEGHDLVPIILDGADKVLSFPPVINGRHTTVTSSTKNFFIDVTGWDEKACECCILLIALQLQQWGGVIESIELTNLHGQTSHFPDGSSQHYTVPQSLIQSFLGRDFSDEELQHAMNRMGGEFVGRSDADSITVAMPRWRYDLLHPVDIVEDIAIGHGYEDLGTQQPTFAMTGQPRHDAHFRRRIRESMQGMGFMQVQSLTLSNEDDQFNRMRWKQIHDVTIIANPITTEHTMLRQFILPSLMKLLASNKHHELPQLVYELGTVVRNHTNSTRLSFLAAERSGGFAALRGRIQAFCRDLGIIDWSLEPLDEGDGPFLFGRSAKWMVRETWVGCIGELDPSVSKSFDLRVPISGADIDIDLLASLIEDPVG
ncbi:MAG: phenylalanine--tRNA ligase subunit beta [archaeon]|nr:phenylalanine--tRNA ligase subunit beta [archaeon]MDA0842462.1 phenylalanine--tRNA ligase subunit beta [archaeon]